MKTIARVVCMLFVLVLTVCSCGASTHSLSVSPRSLSFGQQPLNTPVQTSIIIRNNGSGVVNIQSISINGSSAFQLLGSWKQHSLQPSTSLTLEVVFTPTVARNYSGSLLVNINGPTQYAVSLVGSGIGAVPSGSVTISPQKATITAGSSQKFVATLSSGASNTAVIWNAGLGSISSDGTYTAPRLTAATSDTVSATLVSDSSKYGTASINVMPSSSSSSNIPSSFFGLHVNHRNSPWPTLPFSDYRTLGSSIKWADINTAKGVYDWSRFDAWLAKAQAGGQDVLFTLYATPSWASLRGINSSNPDYGCSFQAQNGPGICDPPDDIDSIPGSGLADGSNQHFREFVTSLINHVGPGKIKYWEIWNEPNVGAEWNNAVGTKAQLVRMAKDARAIVKAVDPNAMFLTPPCSSAGQCSTRWFTKYLQAGGGQYADIVGTHSYLGGLCPANCPVPENIANQLDQLRTVMSTFGLQDKPIFVTEGSWGSNANVTDPDFQVAFLARYYLVQLAKGVSKFYWYGWDFTGTEFYNRQTGQLTAAGKAYEQVYNWVAGGSIGACSAAGTRWTCILTRPNGYEALVLWDTSHTCSSSSCPTISVSVNPMYIKYRDLAGNTNTVVGDVVPVSAKPILLENQ